MKKRLAGKQTRRLRSSKKDEAILILRRFIIFTGCLTLFISGVAYFNRHAFTQAVAGTEITRGLFMQGTITLPKISGAVAYNIYYKTTADSDFVNAVRSIPASISTYTISYLKKGVTYQYKIAAIDAQGAEFWWSPLTFLANMQQM